MAYFALLWKARTIEKYRLNYEKEKLNSIRLMNAHNPQKKSKSLYQRLCHYNCNTKKRISKTFLRFYPEGSPVYNFFYYLKTDQTFPNFLLKSVLGFVGGIVLTYLCFMFFVFQLSISLIHATIMSSIIGVLLTLGLAFSYRIRCLVFLLIPQFFSRVGRYTLTCYALVLILTGPATNTLKNSEVLSESLACAEEQVKTNMYQINESVKKPYNSMKDSIGLMVGGIKQLAAKIKKTTENLHRLTLSLANSLQSSFTWLNSVAESCNKNLGSPYNRCNEAIKHSISECQAALGPWYWWLCDVSKLSQVACWPIKPLTAFCHTFDFANGNILGVVTKKLNAFSERINSMLYLEVHVHHSYSFSSNASRSASQVAAGIVTEIRNKADLMLTWLSWSSCVTSLSLLLIIFRAKYYQHMYETRSRFDNRYVTKELIDLDLKRLRQGRETVLPLNRREEGKYIKSSSFRLVSSEKVHLSRSAVTMAITTFKLLIHMVADYSLYWVLMTIRHHGLYQTPLSPENPVASAHVSGSALISKIMLSLVRSITLPLATPPPSTITCLPNPHPPDFQRYLQIVILIFLLWFFALFEPYGLRLRHFIMGLYRPERAKARAVWLFNHIQRTRGSFIKFARRKLHREYKYSTEEQHTFRRWLREHIPFVGLRNFLGLYPEEPHCFLCGIIEACIECDGSLVRCHTPGCPGTYCVKCFSDIGELCTICLSPTDYGDISDVSLEKGSSEESDGEEQPDPSCSVAESDLHKDDESEDPSPQIQPKKTRRWSLFRRKDKKKPEEHPLLEQNNTNEAPDKSKRKFSKAMMVRHKKYTDFDLKNQRRKALLSLGEDTACPLCYNHCEVCAINKPVNYTNELQKAMKNAANDKTYIISNTNTRKRNKSVKVKNIREVTDRSKQASSIDESVAKVKQRFRDMRKYTLKRRHSHPVIRTKSNRTILLKIPSSLKFKKTSKKRKKRLKTNISLQRISVNMESARLNRCKKQKRLVRTSSFANKIINLVRNIRSISSTVVEYDQNSDRYFDMHFKFKEKHTRNTITNLAMDQGKDTNLVIAGPSKVQAEKNAPQKERMPNIEENIKEENVTKYVDHKKPKRKGGKLYNFCTSYWKNGRIFSPPIKIVNYSANDESPILFDTTNHKKRKKVESSEEIVNPRKSKKENEATRKYRISTYLSEQDWMKKRCKDSKQEITLNAKDEVLKELFDGEAEVTKTTFRRTVLGDKKDAAGGKGDSRNNKRNSPELRIKESLIDPPEINITKEEIETPDLNTKKSETHSPKKHDKKNKKHIDGIDIKTKKQHKDGHHKKVRIHLKEAIEKEAKKVPKETKEVQKVNKDKILSKAKTKQKDKVVVLNPAKDPKIRDSDAASSVEFITAEVNKPISKSLDYGGMSMSRSLGYYRSLGNRDFDPYMDFQDTVPVESVMMVKEATEKQIEVKVSVEDAKAQTTDQLPTDASLKENPASKKQTKIKSSDKKDSKKKNTKKSEARKTKSDEVNAITSKKSFNPFSSVVRWFHLNSGTKKRRVETGTDPNNQSRSDVEVAAFPVVQNNFSQYGDVPLHDQTTQIFLLKEVAQSMSQHTDMFRDVGIDAVTRMRNGATQYTYSCRHAATYYQAKPKHKTIQKDASTIHFNAMKFDVERDTMTNHNPTQDFGLQCCMIERNKKDEGRKCFTDYNISVTDVAQHPSLKSCRSNTNLDERDVQEIKSKTKVKEDLLRDFQIADNPRQIEASKNRKENYTKTEINEILQEFKTHDLKVQEPVRSAIFKKNVPQNKKTDTVICPHCGAPSSSETTSSLGVFQSLPSMESANQKNYDLRSESEDSKTDSETDYDNDDPKIGKDNSRNKYFKTDSEDTKTTDTAVYMSTVEYDKPRRRGKPKLRLSVVTKSNIATSTEATKVCDVSTVTSDWWSPILERKNKKFSLSKKAVQVEMSSPKRKKMVADRGVGTEGRIVTFSSNAQIIPSMHTHLNLMSPSRYLLESQKYYNELFSNEFYTSSNANDRYSVEKRYTSNRRHVQKKKGYRTRNLEESYSPPPKRLSPFMEQVWTAETVHQRLPSTVLHSKKPRSYPTTKIKEVSHPKGLQTKGVRKTKHPQRYSVRKPELKIKRGEVNLLSRRYLSNDNLSLENDNCNSLAGNSSF